MKINKYNQKGCKVFLEIEEDYSEITKAMDRAFHDVIQKVTIPAFRKGKAPRHIYEQYYGKGELIEKASLAVMNDAYKKAIEEKKFKPVDYPSKLDIKELHEDKPFMFEIEVDIEPEIKLGKYTGIKVDMKKADVSDNEVEKMIHDQREKMFDYVLAAADRGVQPDDIVSYKQEATCEEKPFAPFIKENASVLIGRNVIHPDFDKHLEGLKKGAQKEFDLVFDDKAGEKEARGKTVHFKITIEEIKEKKLPELNDEFAAKISDKKTLQELKSDLKERMHKDRQQHAEGDALDELFKKIIAEIEVEIPAAMIKEALERRKQNTERMLQQYRIPFDQFIAMSGKTVAQWEEENKPQAIDDVKIQIMMDAIAKEKSIKPTEAELEAELKKTIESLTDDDKKQKDFNARVVYIKHYLQASLTERKTIDFLKENNKFNLVDDVKDVKKEDKKEDKKAEKKKK